MNAASATVCLIDDNDAFRQSTRWLLEAAGFDVVDFASGSAALHEFRTHGWSDPPPACVICDIRMPGLSGLELHDELIARGHRLPMVFVTAHGDVPMAVEAMRKGALDFVEKPFSEARLIDVVRRAMDSDGVADTAQRAAVPDELALLTPRERQVLERVMDSKSNKMIAAEMGISIKTVELHRSHMMQKLNVRTVPALMKLVLGHGR